MKKVKDYLDLLQDVKVKEIGFEKDFVSYTVRYNDEDEVFDLFAYNMEKADIIDIIPKDPYAITVDGKREA